MIFIRRFILKAIRLNNWILLFSSISLIFCSAFIMSWLEPQTFTTPFISLWWVMTTVTTVGYGDYFPVTIQGKIYAMFLYIFGIGLIGVLIGKIVEFFSEFRKKREEGRLTYKGVNHIVIIGWSQKAKYAVQEILDYTKDLEVVIIDQLEKTPLLLDRVHYIKGQATNDQTLEQANLKEAKAVLLFADDKISDGELADGKSLLIATSIERLNENIHTTVEIMNENHIKNFQHIHVNDFLLSHETISSLAVRSAIFNGITNLYSQLISRRYGEDLFQIPPKKEWTTYKDAFESLLLDGATLIADKNELNINRRLDERLKPDSLLYIICDSPTYEKIISTYKE